MLKTIKKEDSTYKIDHHRAFVEKINSARTIYKADVDEL